MYGSQTLLRTFTIPKALSEHTESGMAMPTLPPSKVIPLLSDKETINKYYISTYFFVKKVKRNSTSLLEK
jgi:hypothetical protein